MNEQQKVKVVYSNNNILPLLFGGNARLEQVCVQNWIADGHAEVEINGILAEINTSASDFIGLVYLEVSDEE